MCVAMRFPAVTRRLRVDRRVRKRVNEWTGPVTPKAAAEWDDYPPSTTFASGELLDVIDPDLDEEPD